MSERSPNRQRRRPKLAPGDALSGFIDSDPVFTPAGTGAAKFYARIGVEHFRRGDDGIPVQAGTTYHHLVAFRDTAEVAHGLFAQGDRFIAQGYVHPYTNRRGDPDEEFVAVRLGHDPVHTDYTVVRDQTPDRVREPVGAKRTPPQAFGLPDRVMPDRHPDALSR